ncbi:MAG: hypothetical protein ACRCVJ_18680 [Clostridium sp.]|uniref:hypothetical protein n=1 Tax=Clostridium sp. TaxID=1506 RepID=UPI003F2CCE16
MKGALIEDLKRKEIIRLSKANWKEYIQYCKENKKQQINYFVLKEYIEQSVNI